MHKYTATEMRTKFKEAYNKVRYSGEPVVITNHGDESVMMIKTEDVYPNTTPEEMFEMARLSGIYTEDPLLDYEE